MSANGDVWEDVRHDTLEPIAIVGFSFKFPQEATSTDAFWQMLMEGRCASTDFPTDRIKAKAFYHPEYRRHDSFHFKGGHFLKEDLGSFDAPFFGIKPSEAIAMDPLQRKMLEVTYGALQNACLPIEKLSGSQTSVYTASFADDYRLLLHRDTERIPKYAFTGTTASFLANRISWFYNWKGPSLAIDSACSGSLVALDHACQSLRSGDSSMSIVGGGSVIIDPANLVSMSNVNFFSPDSRCFSFDSRANGYSKGEGVAVVVLQRLSDAIRDGNCIRAVIRSTGTSSNGHSLGITRPSSTAQEKLIRDTYRKAGLSLKQTRYFEAHATGTIVGDPIEASAIGATFLNQRKGEEPMFVGAVKSNIGHLEGGSGLAGLIKTVLILERGVIPPNANFEKTNPKINKEELNIEFPRHAVSWPGKGLRRASINSFGVGGANSHVVLDDAYHYLQLRSISGCHQTVQEYSHTLTKGLDTPNLDGVSHLNGQQIQNSHGTLTPVSEVENPVNVVDSDITTNGRNGAHVCEKINHIVNRSAVNGTEHHEALIPKLLVWSAADREALKRYIESYKDFFGKIPEMEDQDAWLNQLAYTLNTRRSVLLWRTFTLTSSISTLKTLQVSSCEAIKSIDNPNLAFVFNGQGSQYSRMGRELLAYPVFRTSIENADKFLATLGCAWSLIDELEKDGEDSNIDKAAISQPACTVIQVALVDLLGSFGLFPSFVVGHSSGEIATAYCTGAISARSAWKISYYRGLLSESLSNSEYQGGMLAVGLAAYQARPYLARLESQFDKLDVVIACINSPKSITLSGRNDQIEALIAFFDDDNVFNRRLRVNLGYHSPQMTQIATEYSRLLNGGIEPGEPAKNSNSMISSLKGRLVKANEVCDSEYWVENMTQPVKFSQAMTQLLSGTLPIDSIVEIGPDSTLQGPIRDVVKSLSDRKAVDYTPIMLRSTSALNTLLNCIGKLHCRGHQVDLSRVNATSQTPQADPTILMNLPDYPFDDSRTYWVNTLKDKGYRFRERVRNDLLGTQVPDWNPLDAKWCHTMKPAELEWAKDHVVNGSIIYPGAGMIVMAIEAARQTSKNSLKISAFEVRKVMFQNPLVIPLESDGVEVSFTLRRLRHKAKKLSPWSEFILSYHQSGQWVENCRGLITTETEIDIDEIESHQEIAFEVAEYQRKLQEAAEKCETKLATNELYGFFEKCGLKWGPSFQLLRETLSDEGDIVVSNIAISGERQNGAYDAGDEHPEDVYVIHPTTLDAFIHLLYIPLSKGCTQMIPTSVPTSVQRLWISSDGLNYQNQPELVAMSKLSRLSPFLKKSSLFAVNPVNGAIRIVAEGVETTTVANTTSTRHSDHFTGEQRYHQYVWKPDMSLMEKPEVISYLQQKFDQEEDPSFFENLTQLLLMFVTNVLADVSHLNLTDMDPHHQKYIAWMQLMQRNFDSGMLPDASPEWKTTLSDVILREKLCNKVANHSNAGKFYVEIGRNLLAILQGKVNIHELLFQGDLAKDFYQDLYSAPLLQHSWIAYLEAAIHENPRMRILEIGGGTGGATELVLKTLSAHGTGSLMAPRYKQYDFTDISPAFFEKARARFPEHLSKMNFRIFDVEKDPEDQGFEIGSYDMILAFGSIHITPDLSRSISNARKLLKPGGTMILGEVTRPEILRTSFAFGLFANWWLSKESYRQWSPSVPEPRWDELLLQNGFSGNDIVMGDYKTEICKEVSIIVSTAVSEPKHIYVSEIVIVIDPDSSEQIAFSYLLQSEFGKKQRTSRISSLGELSPSGISQQQLYISLMEYEVPILEDIDEKTFLDLKSLMLSTRVIFWVTGGGGQFATHPGFGIIDGLSRSLRNENANLKLITLALERSENSLGRHVNHILKVLDGKVIGSSHSDIDQEYFEQNVNLGINRLVEVEPLKKAISDTMEEVRSQLKSVGSCPPLQLSIRSPGLLETFEFLEDKNIPLELEATEVEIKVKAVGISIMDCLAAMGRYEQGWLGNECSGTIVRCGVDSGFQAGDDVAFLKPDCYRTLARSRCAVRIPKGMSFTDAASIPTSYTIAYYSLKEVARMRPGESVLVNSAVCGVGQACVELAKLLGVDVFATVGSPEEKELLMKLFDLPKERVLLNNNNLWSKGIRRLTNERGVDVVLNALEESGLAAAWDCLAPFGRLVEIGPDGKSDESRLRLPPSSNLSYSTTSLRALAEGKPELAKSMLFEIMSLFASGKLAIPKTLYKYSSSRVGNAFRDLLTRNNIGKTVLSLEDDEVVQTLLDSKPAYTFDPLATYLISGGLGTCGRVIAKWMITRGARNLVLLSRYGSKASPVGFLKSLQNMGARIETPPCDVSNRDSVKSMIRQISQTLPPIKGCIQAATTIKNVNFEKMSFQDWDEVTRPKVQGSWNLHSFLPTNMDFFIMLSSMAAAVGFSTQANYAASNTYQDSLAVFRQAKGQPGVSLNLGPINIEGPSTQDPVVKELVFNSGNHVLQSADDLCALLDHFCNPQLSGEPARILMGINDPINILKTGREEPAWMQQPLFSHFYTRGDTEISLSAAQQQQQDVAALLTRAKTDLEAASIITRVLIKKLASTLSLEEETLDESRPMHAYGVDSLVAVEIRNWVARELHVDVAIFDIMGGASLASVGGMLASKSAWRKKN